MEIIWVGVGLAVGLALFAFAQMRAKSAGATQAALAKLLSAQEESAIRISELGGALGQVARDQQTRYGELSKTLNDRLDAVSRRVGDTLSAQGEKAHQSLAQLQERLAVIDRAQKNIVDLSSQVVSLQDILANKQARGAFGQIQMEDIVRKALPPDAYAFQATLANGKRCDCIIHLPNPPGSIVIDSKFPLEPFHALRNATNDAAQKDAARLFRVALARHIDDIAGKYILAGETAESALMFLPSEAIYAELHANFVDIVDKSHAARVYVVSPTTLMATLNTMRAVLRDARMREQAGLIQKEVAKLVDDIGRLDKRVKSLRSHFSQAEGDIKDIETSAAKIARTSERIAEVEFEESRPSAAIDNDRVFKLLDSA